MLAILGICVWEGYSSVMLRRGVAFFSVSFALLSLAPGAVVPEAMAQQRWTPESHTLLVRKHAALNGIPESLVFRMIKIESGGNPRAVSKGNYGLMQIRLGTAKAMGYTGDVEGLLDADTNMTYAVKYLAGAYRAADGSHDRAIALYQRGYFYEAKAKGFSPYQRPPTAPPSLLAALQQPAAAPQSALQPESPQASVRTRQPKRLQAKLVQPVPVTEPAQPAAERTAARLQMQAALPPARQQKASSRRKAEPQVTAKPEPQVEPQNNVQAPPTVWAQPAAQAPPTVVAAVQASPAVQTPPAVQASPVVQAQPAVQAPPAVHARPAARAMSLFAGQVASVAPSRRNAKRPVAPAPEPQREPQENNQPTLASAESVAVAAPSRRRVARHAAPRPESQMEPQQNVQTAAPPAHVVAAVAPSSDSRSLLDGFQTEFATARGTTPSRTPHAQPTVYTEPRPTRRYRQAAQTDSSSGLFSALKKLVEPDKKTRAQPRKVEAKPQPQY